VIKLARGGDGRFALASSGDVFNAEIYLARAGCPSAFASALGDDAFSNAIVSLGQAEGVATDLILRVPGRLPGLIVADADAAGDGFNAGYLAARLAGRGAAESAQAAHRLAGQVIRHRGAIVPRAGAAAH
jgi:sugar/nucleoside kinase (ribokinase family)